MSTKIEYKEKVKKFHLYKKMSELPYKTFQCLLAVIDHCNYSCSPQFELGYYHRDLNENPACVGKLVREGFLQRERGFGTEDRNLYILTPFLYYPDTGQYGFDDTEYQWFLTFKERIINLFEDKDTSYNLSNEIEDWNQEFLEPTAKFFFGIRRDAEKDISQNYSLHDVVYFKLKNKVVLGSIVKKNPLRALVRLNSGERWHIPYGALGETASEAVRNAS